MASLVNIALFGASSYFLAIKESSAFFKAYNKPVKNQAEDKTS
jgi:hypothetical protein